MATFVELPATSRQPGKVDALSAILSFGNLSPKVVTHVRRVYAILTASVGLAVAGAYVSMAMEVKSSMLHTVSLVPFAAFLIFYPVLSFASRLALQLTYSFTLGAALGPFVSNMLEIDPNLPFEALAVTLLLFASLSVSAFAFARRRYLLLLAPLATNALLALCVATFFSRLTGVGAEAMSFLSLYGGLCIFSTLIFADTQVMIARAQLLEEVGQEADPVFAALELFLDAVNVFLRVSKLLSKDKKKDSK